MNLVEKSKVFRRGRQGTISEIYSLAWRFPSMIKCNDDNNIHED